MSRLSVVQRLYMGFGLICLIVTAWGLSTIWMADGITQRINQITRDAYPLQQQALNVALDTQRLARQVLSLSEQPDVVRLESQYQQVSAALNALRSDLRAMQDALEQSATADGMEVTRRVDEQLGQLARLAELSMTSTRQSLNAAQGIRDGLTSLLVQSAELKQQVSQAAQGRAARDIYINDLVVSLMRGFSSVELLVLDLPNAPDPQSLADRVESIRVNSLNFREDIAELAAELPVLEPLIAQQEAFASSIQSEQGIIGRYAAHRQLQDEIDVNRRRLAELIVQLDATLGAIVQRADDSIAAAAGGLESAARQSRWLATWLLPVALGLAGLISFSLGRMISRPLAATVDQVVAMSKGDYSRHMAVVGSGEFAVLTGAVNRLVDSNRALLEEMQRSVTELASVSAENRRASQDVSQRMQAQQRELLDVSSAMVEMEAAIHEVSTVTGRSQAETAQIDQDAEQGAQLMQANLQQTVDLERQVGLTAGNLRQLAESSEAIGAIVTTIEQIADQTSLLALNAAIEAARAGESGRGFAVVADEVRGLASRTTQSTEHIRAMIGRLQTDAVAAVTEMQHSENSLAEAGGLTRKAFAEIGGVREGMSRIRDTTMQIATSMHEQEVVASRVAAHVHDFSAGAEESFGQIQALAEHGDQLDTLMLRLQNLTRRFTL